MCLCGGIGRRDRLKIYCPLGRVRSIRIGGTTLQKFLASLVLFTEIIDSSLLSSHLADLLKAVFLGFIEGLTEFLPVSSTAHLIISSHLINFSAIANNIFEITIQIGAILAIILLYRKRIFDVLLHLHHKKQQKFALNVVLAFLPAAFIGLAFHSIIKQFLFSNFVIALALILGGLIMILIDKNPKVSQQAKVKNLDDVSNITALKIGFFQCLAMIPGVSRSGATIIGGMLLKLDRKTAAEFSFFFSNSNHNFCGFIRFIKKLFGFKI